MSLQKSRQDRVTENRNRMTIRSTGVPIGRNHSPHTFGRSYTGNARSEGSERILLVSWIDRLMCQAGADEAQVPQQENNGGRKVDAGNGRRQYAIPEQYLTAVHVGH